MRAPTLDRLGDNRTMMGRQAKVSVRRVHKPTKAGTAGLAEAVARLTRRFRDLERRVEEIGGTDALALEAAALQSFNQQQALTNLDRLRADLEAMRAKGIIDEHGRRVAGIPDMAGGSCDA
jgi:hypothetical protein